jgi:hypothetical protein
MTPSRPTRRTDQVKIFGREPALWIGTIVSIILAVVSVLVGDGVITDVFAGRVTDIATSVAELLILLMPLITAAIIRPTTTPLVAPSLPVGTRVLIAGSGDEPPPDGIVKYATSATTTVSPRLIRDPNTGRFRRDPNSGFRASGGG